MKNWNIKDCLSDDNNDKADRMDFRELRQKLFNASRLVCVKFVGNQNLITKWLQ